MSEDAASKSTGLRQRVSSGLLVGLVVATCAILGGWPWFLLNVAFFTIAYREMMGLMAAKDIHPSKFVVLLFGLSFNFFAFFGLSRHFQILITTGVIFSFGWLLLRKKRATISDIGGTIMMFFYLGFLPAHFILLRDFGLHWDLPFVRNFLAEPGLRYLFLLLFAVSASDVFAYFAGKRFGRKLLSPGISPKKTVEGAVVGTILASLICAVASTFFGIFWGHGLAFGLLMSIVAQVGDLSESLIKRDAGLKDSGDFIPGHGGILDRTDSYIFSGAVGYYYILWFVLHQGLGHEVLEMLK